MKMRTRIAIRWESMLLCLVLAASTVPIHAQSSTTQFVPFGDFMQNVTNANSATFVGQPGYQVNTATSFEAMRQHIVSMYSGVTVSHSFVQDSQQFDCIAINQQPSVRLLGIDSVATPPPDSMLAQPVSDPNTVMESAQTGSAGETDQFGNSMQCENGTIPMARVTLEDMSQFTDLQAYFAKDPTGTEQLPSVPPQAPAPTHKYAYFIQTVNNRGGNSGLNLWRPPVATSLGEVFSLSQQWYASTTNPVQTAEVGWQNYPAKYRTQNSVLFIYWTADGYRQTGCYNLNCPAFVQINRNWHFGAGFTNYSTIGGTQYEFTAEFYLYEGNWWLALGGAWVGYYPGTLYRGGQMTRNAQTITYGGETVGSWIWPPMGSGRWANAGFRFAANQRNVFYIDPNSVTWWANLTAQQPSPCYSTSGTFFSNQPGWGIYFYFGGPGGRGC
jgi:hypothetical protein